MALGSNHIITGDVGQFIPELWSDDVIASYKSNLVVGNLVSKINHKGKKGDTIHIPKPSRGSANQKAAETQVTLNNPAVGEVMIYLDKHYEYSVLIEDITDVQALPSLRRFYTDDAGYALAKQVDTDIHALGASLQGGTDYSAAVAGSDGTTVWDATANTNTGNGGALTDEAIRKMIQKLDDEDVPMKDRNIIVPPVEKSNLLGIDRFVLWNQVGESAGANSIRNGLIGDVYGMKVYVSTNCPTITADDGTTQYRVGMMLHKDAMVFAEQMAVRSQTQYKQEYLADLFTSDTIYGTATVRPEGGIAFVVPA